MRPLKAILLGGAIAGACDITYAITFSALRGVAPARVLQTVASGLLGADAFKGGLGIALLGLALHFLIALIWAALYILAAQKIPWLIRRAVPCGLVYGAFIFAAMNLLVLPLSAFPRKVTFPFLATSTGLLVHIFLIGLPIALAAGKTRTEADR